MTKKITHHPQDGFTLIEMLVVIAIIALLVSLITPTVNRAMHSAKNTNCTSNLHQIGVAISTYCVDHKGNFPSTGFYGISPYYNRDQRNFPNSMRDYLGLKEATTWSTSPKVCAHARIFACPGYKGAVDGKGYLMSKKVNTTFGQTVNPWGNISSAIGHLSSKPYSIDEIEPEQIAIRDNDFWEELNHRNHRNALLFDLSVRPLNLDNEVF